MPFSVLRSTTAVKSLDFPNYHVAFTRIAVSPGIPEKRADEDVGKAVSVHVTRTRHLNPRQIVCVNAVQSETGRAVQRAQVDRRGKTARLPEHHVAFTRKTSMSPPGSALGAPMIRSSKPSPFTSPALDTRIPDRSSASMPSSRKPVRAVECAKIERIRRGKEDAQFQRLDL